MHNFSSIETKNGRRKSHNLPYSFSLLFHFVLCSCFSMEILITYVTIKSIKYKRGHNTTRGTLGIPQYRKHILPNFIPWIGFANGDLRSLSTFTSTAGALVADQTNAGETGRWAVTAGKRNVWCGGGGGTGLPPLSLVFEWDFPVHFELGNSLVDCVAPGHSVSSKVRPLPSGCPWIAS